MSFFPAFLYDRVMESIENTCLKKWRRALLKQVSGDVLEVGAGTGANLMFYSDSVTNLVMAEPDSHMRKRLTEKVRKSHLKAVTISEDVAENIDASDESFDFIVTSLVCCSVTDLEKSLLEMGRVLKPKGCLIFIEHVAADDGTKKRVWQDRITPVWRRVMGNCHLNRETEKAIELAGFKINQIEYESMCTSIPIALPTIRGVAEKI